MKEADIQELRKVFDTESAMHPDLASISAPVMWALDYIQGKAQIDENKLRLIGYLPMFESAQIYQRPLKAMMAALDKKLTEAGR